MLRFITQASPVVAERRFASPPAWTIGAHHRTIGAHHRTIGAHHRLLFRPSALLAKLELFNTNYHEFFMNFFPQGRVVDGLLWMVFCGLWIVDGGLRILQTQALGNRSNLHPPSTINHPPSTIHYPPSSIHHPPSTINHPPSTINHPPSTINHPPSTIPPLVRKRRAKDAENRD